MQNTPVIRLWLSLLVGLSLLAIAPLEAQDAATTTVTCKDGSSSNAGRGACSHHGGVNKNAAASTGATDGAAATASSTAADRTAAKPADSGAAKVGSPTAKCKDGTMSYSKTHTGACSHHGGVAQFLDK